MSWYPVPDINVAADKSVQTAVNIIKSKIMTTSADGLTINSTVNLILKTVINILVILSHNSFRVLFDKIASVYFI